ncbi:hypothetical protein GGS23DRAFT_207448 [Durotheca rogersii]|uniref:uncharacterized protein n=1 Tax=Durotheca rogersii TaxID=419775 RepID=UPI00221F742F|nr:uncharacterized protein GGS23DRAFT_207448 [Durotheca rogersii]KAI5861072.1 hypothetical protein GGS23DRAFT_207448 [Durotheca rogersii]
MLNLQILALLVGASLVGSAAAVVTERDTATTGLGALGARATTITAVEPCPYIGSTCPAGGFNVEYYSNPLGTYGREGFPSSYYITDRLTPLSSSLTNVTGFVQDDSPGNPTDPGVTHPNPEFPDAAGAYWPGWTRDTNGGIAVDANNFTLVYSGYYKAPLSGTYTFCTSADNRNELYLGHGNAFNCWNAVAPADGVEPLAVAMGGNFQNPEACADVELEAGKYYPVRNVMGNWQGPSAFSFTVRVAGLPCSSNEFAGLVYPRECAPLA